VGKGDTLIHDLKNKNHRALTKIGQADINIVFHNRIANLKKIFPYIPEPLNRILLYFSNSANRFYEQAGQLLEDFMECELLFK